MYCCFNKNKKAYTYFICIFCGLLPSVCCAFCYGNIFLKVYRSNSTVKSANASDKIKDLASTLFISYAMYMLCW